MKKDVRLDKMDEKDVRLKNFFIWNVTLCITFSNTLKFTSKLMSVQGNSTYKATIEK